MRTVRSARTAAKVAKRSWHREVFGLKDWAEWGTIHIFGMRQALVERVSW